MLFHISWQNLPREEELITIKSNVQRVLFGSTEQI